MSDEAVTEKKPFKLEFNRSWKWLLYFDLVLPGLLYVLAFLPLADIRQLFARLFHSYSLFIVNPIPHPLEANSIMGYIAGFPGLIYHVWLLISALRKKNFVDFGISLFIFLIIILFFFFDFNYAILKPLQFENIKVN